MWSLSIDDLGYLQQSREEMEVLTIHAIGRTLRTGILIVAEQHCFRTHSRKTRISTMQVNAQSMEKEESSGTAEIVIVPLATETFE